MKIIVRLLSTAIFLTSCSQFSNTVHSFEFECGEAPDFERYTYLKFYTAGKSPVDEKDIRAPRSENIAFTNKSCLKVKRGLADNFNVSVPAMSSGLTITDSMLAASELLKLEFHVFNYKNLAPKCPTSLATHSRLIELPLDTQKQDLSGFDWKVTIAQVGGLPESEIKLVDAGRLLFDVSGLQDGQYRMKMWFKQLHSVDQLESSYDCEIHVDRKSPVVSLTGLRRTGESESDPELIAPGEAIRINIVDDGTPSDVFACLARSGSPNQDCELKLLADRVILAPAKGEWTLKAFAQDKAGNRGPVIERIFQVYDSHAVEAIRALSQNAQFAVTNGDGIASILSAIGAYEKYQTLGSSEEKKTILPDVKRAILETSILPREELYFALGKPENRQGIGLMATAEGFALVSRIHNELTNETVLEISPVDGQPSTKINISNLLSELGVPNVKVCSNHSTVVAFGRSGLVYLSNGESPELIKFDGRLHHNGFGISDDCRFIYYSQVELNSSAPKSTTVIGLTSKKQFVIEPAVESVITSVGDEEGSVLVFGSRQYSIVNLLNGERHLAFPKIPAAQVSKVMASAGGHVAVHSRDSNLHIFNKSMDESSAVFQDVESVHYSSLPDEILAVKTGGFTVHVIDTVGASIRTTLGGVFKNISYLGADKDFIVYRDHTVDGVTVFKRQDGDVVDKVFSQTSMVSNVWIANPGYLYFENTRFMKLFQLSDGFVPKILPPHSRAIGLQFMDDGTLLFKSQSVGFSNASRATEMLSSLSKWAFDRDEHEVYPIQSVSFTGFLNQLPYVLQSRDVNLFKDPSGNERIAAIVQKENIAIYDRADLAKPLVSAKLCGDWLLDLDVSADGAYGLVVCLNGEISVFRTDNLQKLVSDNVSGFHPVQGRFGKSYAEIFMTDSGEDLHKYRVVKHPTGPWKLTPESSLKSSGLRLASNGDRTELVTADKASLLRIFDLDLSLKRTPILLNSEFSIYASSVVYAPNGRKAYAGMYDGTLTEVDLETGRVFKVRVSRTDVGPTNIVISPDERRIGFAVSGSVRVWNNDLAKNYETLCEWLRPRRQYFTGLSGDSPDLCRGP
ncbi:hypothetical protein [Oligoflexus tunisiensis]|uniref:hypothetical protein n=1 Tax=Oligoflexus tunisiensis TaxID=708132 RepID=UPI00114D30B5|nr:hypothetical protein [Oligoflexus tunisiensis]